MISSRNSSCWQLFKDLNILPIQSQYIYIQYFYLLLKIKTNFCPTHKYIKSIHAVLLICILIKMNQLDATMIYWSIRSAQHVSGNLLSIIKSVRLRFLQRMVSCCCGGQWDSTHSATLPLTVSLICTYLQQTWQYTIRVSITQELRFTIIYQQPLKICLMIRINLS